MLEPRLATFAADKRLSLDSFHRAPASSDRARRLSGDDVSTIPPTHKHQLRPYPAELPIADGGSKPPFHSPAEYSKPGGLARVGLGSSTAKWRSHIRESSRITRAFGARGHLWARANSWP